MNELIKSSVKQKNITLQNKMPDYMVRAGMNKGNINIENKQAPIRQYKIKLRLSFTKKSFIKAY